MDIYHNKKEIIFFVKEWASLAFEAKYNTLQCAALTYLWITHQAPSMPEARKGSATVPCCNASSPFYSVSKLMKDIKPHSQEAL